MQNFKEEPFTYRLDLKTLVELLRFLWRYRSHPETLEPFLASLKETTGVPETNLSNLRKILPAWREVGLDRTVIYRVDRYLTAGIGAVDLVLMPLILSMGVLDRPLFIALLSVAISLVLVSSSLLVSFVKHDLGIASYGKIHSNLIFLALASGVSAMAATFWHASSLIGVIFLVLAAIAYIACAAYIGFVRLAIEFTRTFQAAPISTNLDPSEPNTDSET